MARLQNKQTKREKKKKLNNKTKKHKTDYQFLKGHKQLIMHFLGGRSTCNHTPHENCQTCLTGLCALTSAGFKIGLHPSSVIKCFKYKNERRVEGIEHLGVNSKYASIRFQYMFTKAQYISKQASKAKVFGFSNSLDFYKTCIGRHFIIILSFFYVSFFTQYSFLFFTLFAILKKRKI